ncbi:MAG: CoA transferase [Deltaproteobacteria bacterium]|nr:MAG: CoA transferase [Deltaproteobacteria bacterium]
MPGPLDGIKVLSFGRVLAGPFASMLLADLGAEVIKIETPRKGDSARANHPFIGDVSSYFLSVNRGKKSVTVNTRSEKGVQIIKRLVEQMDILIENFRPGIMKKMGLEYEKAKEINPRLIYVSISGFGQYGANSHRPTYDMVAQGAGGTLSITGESSQHPVRVGYSIGDLGAALFAMNATLAALYERERSGEGQYIDISMTDCQVALCENACARYFASGEIAQPIGGRHPIHTPFQIFPTKTDSMIVVAHRRKYWEKLCRIVGREDLTDDPRFKEEETRTKNQPILEDILNEIFRTKTRDEWFKIFEENGMIYGPVNNIEQVVHDPHFNERNMFLDVYHSHLGKLKVVGTPMKFSRTVCDIKKASPDLGEHTEEVLKDKLNLSSEEIGALKAEGVI